MAFVHGKHTQIALRDVNNTWRDMTPFAGEVTLPSKAGVAETTVFGRGAKTYIGGLLEGQLTLKGYFDPQTNGIDQVLSGLTGTQPTTGLTVVGAVTTQSNYGQFIFFPSGVGTGIAAIGDVVLLDYNITAPVTGVVAVTASFNFSGAPTLPLTYTAGSQSAFAAATYGLQIVRAPVADVLSVNWLVTAGGAANYPALVGSTL